MTKIRRLLPLLASYFFALLLISATDFAGDSARPAPASAPSPKAAPAASEKSMPPAQAALDHIQVQHILIGFQGSLPNVTRSREEAKKLADEVLARARKGEDFDALVKQFTNDSPPGIYGMSNTGVTPAGPGEYPRANMVKAFGDVGFSLKVGEIGMAEYDPQASRYGWHIIKRLK